MAPPISERVELARLCASRDWSKAIRVLDSLISRSGEIQDIWCVLITVNSSFCNSMFNCLCCSLILIPNIVLTVCFSNRAFCYSKLELYKHVIKDCDRALQLDPLLLQAYILKGPSNPSTIKFIHRVFF